MRMVSMMETARVETPALVLSIMSSGGDTAAAHGSGGGGGGFLDHEKRIVSVKLTGDPPCSDRRALAGSCRQVAGQKGRNPRSATSN